MDSSLILPLITWGGAAGVFCVLFVLGLIYPRSVVTDLKAENGELKAENRALRDQAGTAVATASAMRDLLSAIRVGQELSHPQNQPPGPEKVP